MAKDLLEDFEDDFPLFIEAGFLAVKQLDESAARALFNSAHILRPDHPAPVLGHGYIALNKLELKEAAKLFKQVLDENPGHDLASMFLAICFLFDKGTRAKGKELIEQTMESSDDESVVNLGKVSLDWLGGKVKTGKTPFSAF